MISEGWQEVSSHARQGAVSVSSDINAKRWLPASSALVDVTQYRYLSRSLLSFSSSSRGVCILLQSWRRQCTPRANSIMQRRSNLQRR